MKKLVTTLAASAVLAGLTTVAAPATPAEAAPTKYKNCAALNKHYPHGVGRPGARDRTKTGKPVKNFRTDRATYQRNTHLDRDKDGIACEKR